MSRVLPILFNADMVRATLDGRKTVTRRVIKPQPKMKLCYTFAGGYKKDIGKWGYPSKTAHEHWGEEYKHPNSLTEDDFKMKWNPPYHADDILYVKETFAQVAKHTFWYKAGINPELENILWKPSIHMPKEAARLWLKVTDVRVERLQDITFEECLNEGAFVYLSADGYFDRNVVEPESKKKFADLWNSAIKNQTFDRYGWDADPWVWVIEFERCEKPEPCILAGKEPAEDKRPCIGYGHSWDDEPCEMCKGCKYCIGNGGE